MKKNPRIMLVINVEWYFWSHRLSLAKALRDSGYEVVVAASVERGYQQAIEQEGFRFIPLHLKRSSTNFLREIRSVVELYQLYRSERPDIIHHITIKPVLYGSLAAKLASISAIVNTIPGLGYTFSGVGPWGKVVRWAITQAYRFALLGPKVRVIFQNPEDRVTFCSSRIVSADRTTIIRSSGVDHRCFTPSPQPLDCPIVLLASRLIWDKGIGALVEAARQIKSNGTECRIVIVGIPDAENPNAVPVSKLEEWQSEKIIEWWGLRNDMPFVIALASIVVLPTYYPEGVPKILLEAAASCRPIVATDTPGCREIVRHGENGLLVPSRDPVALANALQRLLVNPEIRSRMGVCGREIALNEFSEDQVISETLAVYRDLLGERRSRQL